MSLPDPILSRRRVGGCPLFFFHTLSCLKDISTREDLRWRAETNAITCRNFPFHPRPFRHVFVKVLLVYWLFAQNDWPFKRPYSACSQSSITSLSSDLLSWIFMLLTLFFLPFRVFPVILCVGSFFSISSSRIGVCHVLVFLRPFPSNDPFFVLYS